MSGPEVRSEADAGTRDPPLESYGVIGDLRTVALIGPHASVDQLCWPRFDSPSVFAAHVDRERGGHFAIESLADDPVERKLYFPETNILLSRFLSDHGVGEVSDLMLRGDGERRQALVRRAKSVHGEAGFRLRCAPRFDYARAEHDVEARGEHEVVFRSRAADGLALRLRSEVPLRVEGRDVVAEFTLEPDESAAFVLEDDEQERGEEPLAEFASSAFKLTSDFWRDWLDGCRYQGRWRESVHRAVLALKLLTSEEHGSVVAAGTFGLPCDPGEERNWDYRYTWLRDAAFTMYALMRLGFTREAGRFMGWLEQRIQELDEGAQLQTMYRVDGARVEGEQTLDHLRGYRGSRPVRVGSSNHGQFQLDIYGELMDSIYLYDKYGSPLSYDLWMKVLKLVDFVAENWQRPDASIWEVRAEDREFLYSRVMCWVALDRAARLARKRSYPAPVARWRETRDAIYRSVHEEFWCEEKGAFVQFRGTDELDAAALIMPLVRFISPTDPRWLSTLHAIREELAEDSLVYRYRVNTAFPEHLGGEDGTFSLCTFWLIEDLARSGDPSQARYLFEKMLSYASPLGVFSEQIGDRGEALGNLPAAFTHLAMISAAFDLDRRLD